MFLTIVPVFLKIRCCVTSLPFSDQRQPTVILTVTGLDLHFPHILALHIYILNHIASHYTPFYVYVCSSLVFTYLLFYILTSPVNGATLRWR